MATNYPGGQDTFDTIPPTTKMSEAVGGRTHRAILNDVSDAVEAVELELGTDPSGSETNVVTRLAKIEDGTRLASNSITATQIAANAVGSSELADNAVDTAAIADGAVTAAKIADGTITATDVAAGTFAAFGTVGNLLTANQASIETDTTGFAVVANCAIARSTAAAAHGSACLTATSSAAGDTQVGIDLLPITAGERYTATFEAQAPSITASLALTYVWWDASAPVAFASVDARALSTSWQRWTFTGVAPAGATRLEVRGQWTAVGAGEVVRFDKWGVWKGAGGQWAMPGVPIVGQSLIATNNAVHLSGTGTPEGVVTAAPGSTWLQTDSTTDVKGWLRWVKATGTGNTGWVAGAEADTGWRKVTLLNSWANGTDGLYIRRIGEMVYVHGRGISGASGPASAYTMYVLPTAFIPAQPLSVPASKAGTSFDGIVHVDYADIASGTSGGVASYTALQYEAAFPTAQAWPSSLPGSAA